MLTKIFRCSQFALFVPILLANLMISGNIVLAGSLDLAYSTSKNAVFYVSPKGNDGNAGTIDRPFKTWQKAVDVVQAGDLIYLRGGTYYTDPSKYRAVVINKSGAQDKVIRLWAYPNEKPVLKCNGKNIIGLALAGDYWHFSGIEITGITQYSDSLPKGFLAVNSNNNIFERINSHHNGGSGFVLSGKSSNNLIKNCDFHDNYDPIGLGGDADGMSIGWCEKGCVNAVYGCRMWNNSDDGLDLWKNEGIVYLVNCWSWHNGYLPGTDNVAPNGDGQGFKFGRTDMVMDTQPQRIVKNCKAFYNKVNGFDQNLAQVIMNFDNNVSYKNGAYGFFLYLSLPIKHSLTNNIAIENIQQKEVVINEEAIQQNNSWQKPDVKPVFQSLDPSEVLVERNPDGTLPKINFLNTSANKAPSSQAGANQVVYAGTLVTLDGTGSTDAENDALTYHWIAPGGITLSSETEAKPTFAAPTFVNDTSFVFSLVVSDGESYSSASQVKIDIRKAPPVLKLLSKANNALLHGEDISYMLYFKKENTFSEESLSYSEMGDTARYTLQPGEWIVLANPHSGAAKFLPTYAGNTMNWGNAEHIFATYGDNILKEINCLVPEGVTSGKGQVSGYVYENSFTDVASPPGSSIVTPTRPIKNALVRIFKIGGTVPVLSGFTDSSGYYNFENLNIQGYEVAVDLPGFLQAQKMMVVLTEEIAKASVYFSVNKTNQLITEARQVLLPKVRLYPDPTTGIVYIYGLETASRGHIKVFSSDGILVFERAIYSPSDIVDITNQKSGTYLFVVNSETFKILKK